MHVPALNPRWTAVAPRILSALLLSASTGALAAGDGQPAQEQQENEQPAPAPAKPDPFAFADFTWLTGNPRTTTSPLDTPPFTFEFRVDTSFHYDFHHPADNTIVGSSEAFRSDELPLTQLCAAGDLNVTNVLWRL